MADAPLNKAVTPPCDAAIAGNVVIDEGRRRFAGKPGFIDVTLRDAHQCLWATRMTTEMMTPILSRIDNVGYSYINILGGAVFDVCVRYLHENPWRRIKLLSEHLQTPTDGLTPV